MAGENGEGGMRTLLLTAVGILVMTIISGGFYYTSSVAEEGKAIDTRQTAEKQVWRSEHNKVLDEKFKSLEKGQESLRTEIHTNQEKVERGLDKVMGKLEDLSIEQKAQSKPSSMRRSR